MSLRLCLATDSREPSGVGEHMLVLAGELRHRYHVVVACPQSRGGDSLIARAARCGLQVKVLDDRREATVDWLRRQGLDLLHLHAGIGWEGHELAADGREAGVPRIVRTEHLPDLITDPAQRVAHADGLALVDKLICVSVAAATSFRATGVDSAKIAVVRNGLPHRTPVRSRSEVRRDLGLGPAQGAVLTTARFTPQKDHTTLIDAVPAVLERHPEACFLLAGDGPLEDDCRRAVGDRGLSHAVRFLGNRSDIPDLLAAVDLFVLPSRFEGLPLALLEAMDAGLPVVSTRVGGTDEVVVDGLTGFLVPPGDASAFAAAIVTALSDPARQKEMAEAGLQRFRESFTATRMADETADLYGALGVPPRTEHRMTG